MIFNNLRFNNPSSLWTLNTHITYRLQVFIQPQACLCPRRWFFIKTNRFFFLFCHMNASWHHAKYHHPSTFFFSNSFYVFYILLLLLFSDIKILLLVKTIIKMKSEIKMWKWFLINIKKAVYLHNIFLTIFS